MKTNIPNIAVITLRSLCASLLNHHFARVAIIIGLWYLGLGSQLVLAQSFQCTTTQVTSSVGDWGSSGTSAGRFASANGKRLTFNSSGNFTGGDPDQNGEVYIYDEDTGYTQVTNTNTAGVSGGSNGTLSSNGKRTVFMSYLNLSGQNPDGNDELFLHDSDTGITSQITNTTGFAWIGIGIINANGTKVAFNSQRNLTGGNSDGSMEGFVYDIAAGTTVQITNGIGKDSGVYSVSGDGTRIGIVSNADLVPNQNADGNFEVFVFDSVTGFIQVTVTFGNYFSHGVFLSSDGNHVVYTSNYPLVGNADGNYEIYLFDFADESLTQVTNTTGSGNQSTGISADGSRAIFFSNRNLTGNNSDGNSELFLYDVLSATTTQLSDTPAQITNYRAAISDHGMRMFFDSNGYPNGNADGNREIFMVECMPAPLADVLIGLGVDKTSVKQGEKLTYTITISNAGPNAAENLVINDVLSSGSTFVSASANKGTFTAPTPGQTGVVSWHAGDLASGGSESAQITVTVIARGKTAITNTATVVSDTEDPNSANNTASITVSVAAGGKK